MDRACTRVLWHATAHDRLAVVALRCLVTSPEAFGIAHPLVIMRRGEDSHWKVLQVSPDLTPQLLSQTFNVFSRFAMQVRPEEVVEVGGISQAAPIDGDNRTRFPELWWDNNGGAGLLVVEWQRQDSLGEWNPSHMDLIPDEDHRLKVQVPAMFAAQTVRYRWRVWSVGLGGTTKISPWRTLNIIA